MKSTLYIIIILCASCSRDIEKQQPINTQKLQEQLLQANINATTLESQQIDSYVKSKNLNMIKTPTGLRYEIYEDQEGVAIINNQRAVVKYTVTLLNGTECYATKDNAEEFIVGKDNVESGLHEGITYMSVGDKAIIIIPSHLAHGLAGDSKKIPIRATIIYDVELVAIR